MPSKNIIHNTFDYGLSLNRFLTFCIMTTLSFSVNSADVSFHNQNPSSDEFINAFMGGGSGQEINTDKKVIFRGISLKKSTPKAMEKPAIQEEQTSFNQQVSANNMANACLAEKQSVAVNITFKPNSSKVTDTDLIKNIAKAMNNDKLSDCYFIIEGHTDAVGNNYYNLWLSQKRASQVKQYLREYSVLGDRLVVVGKGEEELANSEVPNANENRRVVFKVINYKR